MGEFVSMKWKLAGKSLILPGKTGRYFCEYNLYSLC